MILQPFGNFETPTNAGDAPIFTVTPAASTTLSAVSPTIQTQPQNQYVIVPATATFGITVVSPSDSGTLSYQWQKYNGSSWGNVGTNSASYTTGATTSGDNNTEYRCIVTNTKTGLTITLSGTAVDPEGNPVTYQWFNNATQSSAGLNPSNSQSFTDISGTFFLRATDSVDGVWRDSSPNSVVTINNTSQTYSNSAYLFASFSPIVPSAWALTSETPASSYSLSEGSTYGIGIDGSAVYSPAYPEVPQDGANAEAELSFPSQAFTTATVFFDSYFNQDIFVASGPVSHYANAIVQVVYNNTILFARLVNANGSGTPLSHQISLDNVGGTKNLNLLKIRVTYSQTVGLGGVDIVDWKTFCSGVATGSSGNPVQVLYTV
jgi:hypothetical protein